MVMFTMVNSKIISSTEKEKWNGPKHSITTTENGSKIFNVASASTDGITEIATLANGLTIK